MSFSLEDLISRLDQKGYQIKLQNQISVKDIEITTTSGERNVNEISVFSPMQSATTRRSKFIHSHVAGLHRRYRRLPDRQITTPPVNPAKGQSHIKAYQISGYQ